VIPFRAKAVDVKGADTLLENRPQRGMKGVGSGGGRQNRRTKTKAGDRKQTGCSTGGPPPRYRRRSEQQRQKRQRHAQRDV